MSSTRVYSLCRGASTGVVAALCCWLLLVALMSEWRVTKAAAEEIRQQLGFVNDGLDDGEEPVAVPCVLLDAGGLARRWEGRRIVAVGDLHGDVMNTLLILRATEIVDDDGKWIGGTTLLIQTGDLLDRGPDGPALLDLFQQLSDAAKRKGGQVLQLLGNHDIMNMCGDFRYVHPKETEQFGGAEARTAAFQEGGKYNTLLRNFHSAFIVNDILFVHAGLIPQYARVGLQALRDRMEEELAGNCSLHNKLLYSELGKAQESEKNDESDDMEEDEGEQVGGGTDASEGLKARASKLFVAGVNGPSWTRDLSLGDETVSCRRLKETLKITKTKLMVVGHTVQEGGRIVTRCDNKLVLIDTGT
eukprot:GHVT01095338.1.p1 GENE.GHVT01095338.1~~GHVT01095338.1.p1  ORF type:complete len:360 (+),score=68.19 GHVT01095338.1:183-1262(+)